MTALGLPGPTNTMNISEFEQFVENDIRGNLFSDLRAMQKIPVTFPLLMTAFAGIELFGALLSQSPFDAYAGWSISSHTGARIYIATRPSWDRNFTG